MDRPRHIAWTPLLNPKKIFLVAIRCHPQQEFDREVYLSLLGDRIQAMVDASPDPKEAVSQLQEEMHSTGLVKDVAHCKTERAGIDLVEGNPEIWEICSNLGVFQKLRYVRQPLIENLMAHQALISDQENLVDGLTLWASLMALER
jgi:hypothetical protein